MGLVLEHLADLTSVLIRRCRLNRKALRTRDPNTTIIKWDFLRSWMELLVWVGRVFALIFIRFKDPGSRLLSEIFQPPDNIFGPRPPGLVDGLMLDNSDWGSLATDFISEGRLDVDSISIWPALVTDSKTRSL